MNNKLLFIMNKKITLLVGLGFLTTISYFILDVIYYKSLYSNLDYIQTLINVNHETRYRLFILMFTLMVYILNLILWSNSPKIKIKQLIFSIIFHFLIINIIYFVLKIHNISMVFIIVYSIIVSIFSAIVFNYRNK